MKESSFSAVLTGRVKLQPRASESEIYNITDRHRILIAEKREGVAFVVHNFERWAKIEELTL